jgi:hypothetical protein
LNLISGNTAGAVVQTGNPSGNIAGGTLGATTGAIIGDPRPAGDDCNPQERRMSASRMALST